MRRRKEKSCINYNLLKERRVQKNFTQYRLASVTGLNHNHLSQIERGLKVPKVITLYKICAALDLELEAVLIKETNEDIE